MHGDQFDIVARQMAGPCRRLGVDRMALRVNIGINWVRRRLHRPYWSLSAWAKHKVNKNAVSVIGRFEEALTLEARDNGVDGVICGHIHFADRPRPAGIHYINTGDGWKAARRCARRMRASSS